MDSTQMLNKLDIPIPDIVYSYDDEKKKEIFEYLTHQIKNNEQQKQCKNTIIPRSKLSGYDWKWDYGKNHSYGLA